MPDRNVCHATRWFGLPGMFMAGILCGALIAAIGYARHGPAVERHIGGWLGRTLDHPSGALQSGDNLVVKPVRTLSI